MYTVSTIVQDSTNLSVLPKREQICTAIDKNTGETCGETESLQILDEFRKLYEARIEKVDSESANEFDRVSMKMKIMTEWIKDLGEQNIMLVNTVQDLEQTASDRVKILEEKLKQSSKVVSDKILLSNHSEERLSVLSNRIRELENDEKSFRQKIEFLWVDIKGLLELLKRAQTDNRWNLDGITFYNINPSDIPTPLDVCAQVNTSINIDDTINSKQVSEMEDKEAHMCQIKFEEKSAELHKNLAKEETVKTYVSDVQSFSNELVQKSQQANHFCFGSSPPTNSDNNIYSSLKDQIDADAYLMDTEPLSNSTNSYQKIFMCFSKTNLLLQKEEEKLDDLKTELQKIVRHLKQKNVEPCEHNFTTAYKNIQNIKTILNISKTSTDDRSQTEENVQPFILNIEAQLNSVYDALQNEKLRHDTDKSMDTWIHDTTEKLIKNIENIFRICKEKKKAIEFMEYTTAKRNEMQNRMNNYVTEMSKDVTSNPITAQQFKLMEEFRVCTVEAQAATEDIREEISTILSSFAAQHQKYTELNKMVKDTQEHLLRLRETVIQAINTLELQEIERTRHIERITAEKVKLKDIKNEFIRAQSELFNYVNNMQEKIKVGRDQNLPECVETYTCNDLLNFVVDKIELVVNHVQVHQNQECFFATNSVELKEQLCCTTCSFQDLQKHMSTILMRNEMDETILCEKEERLGRLEAEIDNAHTKMQDTLETFWNTIEQDDFIDHSADLQSQNQTINELLKAKEDIHKLRKEYDDYKLKTLQKICQTKSDDKINQWKCRIIDLEEQLRILQHETKCKQEANNFLKSSIESMEKELSSVQMKAENYRRSYSVDSIDYQKKILELENIIKVQKEVESKLRKSLDNNEIELQKSRKHLEPFHIECTPEELSICCGYQLKQENTSQLVNILQEAVQSTKSGLQNVECELKLLMCEGSSQSCTSTTLVMTIIDKLRKYEGQLEKCYGDIENLRNTLCSKDKLLENMNQVVMIQNDSIAVTQNELKSLYKKQQEKINMQDCIIAQCEKEKKELSKQNELQAQTIGHLQNAVVEAKRCLDSMGHKALFVKGETIQLLTMFIDETQNQYSDCFTEAAAQEKLLELQRDAIDTLQSKIEYMINDKYLVVTSLHTTYCSILSIIQDQLKLCTNDFQALIYKINTLMQTNILLGNKYITTKKLWKETNQELQELKNMSSKDKKQTKMYETKSCQCKIDIEHKSCMTQNLTLEQTSEDSSILDKQEHIQDPLQNYESQAQTEIIIRENQNLKKQLQKYISDLVILKNELKIKDQEIKDLECCLKYENQNLKISLEKQTKEFEDLIIELNIAKQKEINLKKYVIDLEEKQEEIQNLKQQIDCNKSVIREQAQTIDHLQGKLCTSEQQIRQYISESTNFKERFLSIKVLLKEKSDSMAKLQADYEVLKNENTILKTENIALETKTKEDHYLLRKKLKETQTELSFIKDSYYKTAEDYDKTQENLIQSVRREAELQESLTIAEKEYCSKLANFESKIVRLENLICELDEESKDTKKKLSSKNTELCQTQNMCKSFSNQLKTAQQDLYELQEKYLKMDNSNCYLTQQLQECIDENCTLLQQKTSLEQDNYKFANQLHNMHQSLMELKKECQSKDKSLACVSAELTETVVNRSELCNESQYMVSCIRTLMAEQRKLVETLVLKLQIKQQQLTIFKQQFGHEKKTLLVKIRELRRVNNILAQRLKRVHRTTIGKNTKSAGYSYLTQNLGKSSIYPIKSVRRTSVCGNSWWFPKMEYITNQLRKNNQWWHTNIANKSKNNSGVDENRDCGYQSSASK
ncbi:myosin-11-like isoform X5 [Vespa mandarinia]|uniref:myosin-11-like isoform X5 n=1 Tax=Vespa mandarinia TaxID=7446 RepID=UPI0016139457|nr:myosin-11-like isoform X5 [Vespa mandarinia]